MWLIYSFLRANSLYQEAQEWDKWKSHEKHKEMHMTQLLVKDGWSGVCELGISESMVSWRLGRLEARNHLQKLSICKEKLLLKWRNPRSLKCLEKLDYVMKTWCISLDMKVTLTATKKKCVTKRTSVVLRRWRQQSTTSLLRYFFLFKLSWCCLYLCALYRPEITVLFYLLSHHYF